MKASELIKLLEAEIDKYGDLEVKDHQGRIIHALEPAKFMNRDFEVVVEHFNLF